MDFIFYLTLFCFICLFGTLDTNIDFDFWARLIVGKTFFQTGTLLNNDFYSYGKTHEFIDHEWGSSLVFYLIQNNFSDIGLFIFKSILLFLIFYILTKIIRLEDSKIKLSFLFFFFAIQAISYNIFSTVRCQIFSFFFFVFYLYILKYSIKNQKYRLLFLLPLLNIVWENMHGGFVLGIALIFLYALGEFLNKKTYKPFVFSFVLTILTSLINPYGVKYLTYIYDAFMLKRTFIPEWHSAFFGTHFPFALLKFKIFFFTFLILISIYLIKRIRQTGINEQKIKTRYFVLSIFK